MYRHEIICDYCNRSEQLIVQLYSEDYRAKYSGWIQSNPNWIRVNHHEFCSEECYSKFTLQVPREDGSIPELRNKSFSFREFVRSIFG